MPKKLLVHTLCAICLVLTLGTASPVRADAFVALTATTPQEPGGGHLPDSVVSFEVSLTQDKATATPIRLVQLDFAASDAALTLLGNFSFDWSSIMSNVLYAQFPAYPVPAVSFTGLDYTANLMLEIPAAGAGSLSLGVGSVQLPSQPGTYLLDAVNAGAADPWSQGAQVAFGFDSLTRWLVETPPGDGLVSGNPLALTVVPEPGTAALLGFGLMALATSRRRR